MSDQIQFKFGINKLFRTAKCVNTPLGYFLDIPAVAEDATPIEGSDTLFLSPEILIVTSGAFELQVPEAGVVPLHAGDISSSHRYRSALKIVATADNSSYTCLTPRDGAFWERMAGFVSSGDKITIETPEGAQDGYVFVATGGLQSGAGEHLVGSLVPITGTIEFTGTADAHFVHLWKM